MAITPIDSARGTTSIATMPTHVAGDYITACAFRDGNNTAPTLPSGWTELPSGSSLGAGSNSNGMRLAYKVALGSSEVSGTWSSATSLNIDVYRGVGSIGTITQNEGSGLAINYPANSFTVTDGTSWALLYGAHRSANTDIETPPGSTTLRSDNVDATDELCTFDTNGGVTGWSSTNQTLSTGTSSGWRTVVIELVAAGAASYTLTANNGSYVITGQSATPKAARLLTASNGTYTLTGQAAVLKAGRNLAANNGSYLISGQTMTAKAARTVTANNGSYTITGQNIGLTKTKILTALVGSYLVTGQAMTAKAARALNAQVGTYLATGQTMTAKAARLLTAQNGSYILTGQTATFTKSRLFQVANGSYLITGQAADVKRALRLLGLNGQYTITGQAVILTYADASTTAVASSKSKPRNRTYAATSQTRAYNGRTRERTWNS